MLAGLLLAGVLPGCAGDRAVAAEVDAAADGELRRRPELYVNGEARAWAVRRDGRERGTLWGTIHRSYSGELVMPRPIRDRFNGSASLSVETLPTAALIRSRQRQAVAASTRPDPAALARLPPGTRAALRAAGVGLEDEAKRSLLGLAGLVSVRAARGAAPALPAMGIVDFNLIGFARSVKIPVRELENLPLSEDPEMLDPNGPAAEAVLQLALRRAGAGPAVWETVLGYYGRGDVARAVAALQAWRNPPDSRARGDGPDDPALLRRNRAWMTPLEQTFGEPGTHFVAFGCAHLVGPGGVVALLRERGWDVRPCVGDQCG